MMLVFPRDLEKLKSDRVLTYIHILPYAVPSSKFDLLIEHIHDLVPYPECSFGNNFIKITILLGRLLRLRITLMENMNSISFKVSVGAYLRFLVKATITVLLGLTRSSCLPHHVLIMFNAIYMRSETNFARWPLTVTTRSSKQLGSSTTSDRSKREGTRP